MIYDEDYVGLIYSRTGFEELLGLSAISIRLIVFAIPMCCWKYYLILILIPSRVILRVLAAIGMDASASFLVFIV
jgi:hypothetical protein